MEMSIHLFKLKGFLHSPCAKNNIHQDGWTLFLYYLIISMALGVHTCAVCLQAAIVLKHFAGKMIARCL